MTKTKTHGETSGANGATSSSSSNRAASAREAAHRAKAAIETNPLGLLAGGLAAGLVAGALVPRSERERQALGSLGARLAEGAIAAGAAAKQSGKEQLSAALFSRDGAREGVAKVMESAVTAAKEAGTKAA